MPERATCPNCGDDLAADSPRKLCPRCLFRAGLGGDSGDVSHRGSRVATALVGRVLDSIAATIGPVPRVLLRDTDGGAEPPVHRPGSGDDPASNTRYRIDGEIARGGMGSVLKGRDPDLGRDVALKVLREDFRDDLDMIRRFVEEAQIGGQLQHPGIVPIYEMGIFGDRRPFFAMKLVKGDTLAKLLDGRKDPAEGLPRFLGIFESIAQTVAYSHARGVIHRDLKPSNVMVGSFGEVQVMDWGLAKILPRGGIADDASAGKVAKEETVIATARSGSEDADLSRAGSVMGTPSYMAPEQARGEIDRVDERADVFALGSILCEILTGQPAFTGRTSGEIQRKAALGDLGDATARLDARGADAELVALAKGCLAREADDRPRSAGAVAERATAYLTGVQEKLRRAELESVEERARRRLTTVAAAAVILLGLAGSGGYAWNQRREAERVARTARGVDEALADASRLRGEALVSPMGETARWAEAISAAKRAEGLLAQGEADAPLKGRVAGLMAQLKAEQAAAAEKARRREVDRVLLADLEAASGRGGEQNRLARSDAEFVAAFRKAGLDIDSADPVEAGQWLAKRSEPVELAGYLDEWAYTRINAKRPEIDWRRLVAAARAADPDPWRDALRAWVATRDADAVAEFRRLADDEGALDLQPAPSLVLLARQLKDRSSDRDRAARVLRQAVLRHPADFWAHFELALVRGMPGSPSDFFPQPEESIRHLTAALAIRPGSRMARSRLAVALLARDKADEAIAVRREAVRLDPNDSAVHADLGNVLLSEVGLDAAMPELIEAIRLDPNLARAHYYLAHSLWDKGELDEAAGEYRRAIQIDPRPLFHSTLGALLQEQGKLDEAASAQRESLRLNPNYVLAHHELGSILLEQGKQVNAMVEAREALRLDPDWASGHLQLGLLLRLQGDYPGSLAEYRRGHELGSKQPLWSLLSEQGVADAERLLALDGRLPALLKGDDRPSDNADRLALAQLSYDTKRFATAARFWSEAFGADPKLGDDPKAQRRYNAARAASSAAAGKGVDEPPFDDDAKAKLRARALGWLKADLASWAKLIESGQPKDRTTVRLNVWRWRMELDLAPIRDPEALAKLPEAERKQWQSFWADVETLLKRAEGKTP